MRSRIDTVDSTPWTLCLRHVRRLSGLTHDCGLSPTLAVEIRDVGAINEKPLDGGHLEQTSAGREP